MKRCIKGVPTLPLFKVERIKNIFDEDLSSSGRVAGWLARRHTAAKDAIRNRLSSIGCAFARMSWGQQSLNESLVSNADLEFPEQGSVPMTTMHTPASMSVQVRNVSNEQKMPHSKESTDVPVQRSHSAAQSVSGSLSLRGEIFHVFISYRVSTESDLVRELYHQLMKSAKASKIPGISKWPSKFKKPTSDVASSSIHVFWDAKALAPGLTWKDDGFVSALSKSLVFTPMLSDGVVKKWSSPVVDYVDNVLLELILALEFNKLHSSDEGPSSVHPCKYIVPVFVSDLFSKMSDISKEVSRATVAEAARLFGKLGIQYSSCEYSPHSVLAALCDFQGVKMAAYHQELKEHAIRAAVNEIITAVTMCIQQSSVFVDDFKAHHPRARELCDWLQLLNMSKYTGFLARHGITSVYALSVLDVGSAVPILAEDCALSCGESRSQAIVSLSRAVAMAKSSELSLPLSVRFNRFVDTDASVLSALFSTCGIDTVLSKWEFLTFGCVVSFCCANLGTFVLDIVDHPFLSISLFSNPLFYFIISASCLSCSIWPIFCGGSAFCVPPSEFKPRKLLALGFFSMPCMSTFILVYIKAVHFGSIAFSHSILCQAAVERGALTVSYDTCYLYEMFVIFPVQCISHYTASAFFYSKQEFAYRGAISSFLVIGIVFFCFIEMFEFENLRPLRILTVGLIVLFTCLVFFFESLNMFSKRKAAAFLKKDEEEHNRMWDGFLSETDEHPAKNLSLEIATSFAEVIDDPKAASRWFSSQPRVLQEHSSIDGLFDDVELVDVAFQELISCWLNVGQMQALFLLCQCHTRCRALILQNFKDWFQFETRRRKMKS